MLNPHDSSRLLLIHVPLRRGQIFIHRRVRGFPEGYAIKTGQGNQRAMNPQHEGHVSWCIHGASMAAMPCHTAAIWHNGISVSRFNVRTAKRERASKRDTVLHSSAPACDFAMSVLVRVACLSSLTGCILVCTGCVSGPERFYRGYEATQPLGVSSMKREIRDAYTQFDIHMEGARGHSLPSILTIPAAGPGPFPCVIFLHGLKQDRFFLAEIAEPFAESGFAMASFDQLMCGERTLPEESGSLKEFAALRRRLALTVIETRRLIDYIETRLDIDPHRIYLLGASLGAITGATASAMDKRIKACVLVYGGGSIRKLLSGKVVRDALGPWRFFLIPLIACTLRPADPIRYVGEIAPRPILFQNGRRDETIPPSAANALHNAAGNPKEVLWYDSAHIGKDQAVVSRVLDDALEWLIRVDRANVSSNARLGLRAGNAALIAPSPQCP